MIVLDSSGLLDYLLGRPAGRWVQLQLARPRETIAVPHLADVEIAQVLARQGEEGRLADATIAEMLVELASFRLQRYPHMELVQRAWELRGELSLADGIYVALAELLEAPLYTTDRRLAGARGHQASIELIRPF